MWRNTMRIFTAASAAAKPASLAATARGDSPTAVVCAALALALFVLGCRIASVW
jgi:hypothetical protein